MARFDSLKYAVHKLAPEEPVDRAFPDLFKNPEFKKLRARKDYDKVTRYICFLYDKKTDLAHEFQSNLKDRKNEAARLAGFVRVTADKWPADVQKVMDLKDVDVTLAIIAFMRDQKAHIWMEIVVTEQELDEFQTLRFKPIKKGKGKGNDDESILKAAGYKDKLSKSCDDRIDKLQSLYNQFFDDHADLKAEFEEGITPETAERILAKETTEETQNVQTD